jgi:hypothetical protein
LEQCLVHQPEIAGDAGPEIHLIDRIDVIHAGEKTFPFADRVRAVAAARMLDDIGSGQL